MRQFCLKSTSVALNDANELVITVPNTNFPINNGDILKIKVLQPIPTGYPQNDVYVYVNGVYIQVFTKFHNSVRIEQLATGRIYYMGVGTEIPSLTMLSCIPYSSVAFPAIPVPVA